jgi:hypothetical protein
MLILTLRAKRLRYARSTFLELPWAQKALCGRDRFAVCNERRLAWLYLRIKVEIARRCSVQLARAAATEIAPDTSPSALLTRT